MKCNWFKLNAFEPTEGVKECSESASPSETPFPLCAKHRKSLAQAEKRRANRQTERRALLYQNPC